MFQIIKSLVKYETVCRRRNCHEPNPEDLDDFVKNLALPKETFCKDCESMLELRQDEDDESKYWITEI